MLILPSEDFPSTGAVAPLLDAGAPRRFPDSRNGIPFMRFIFYFFDFPNPFNAIIRDSI